MNSRSSCGCRGLTASRWSPMSDRSRRAAWSTSRAANWPTRWRPWRSSIGSWAANSGAARRARVLRGRPGRVRAGRRTARLPRGALRWSPIGHGGRPSPCCAPRKSRWSATARSSFAVICGTGASRSATSSPTARPKITPPPNAGSCSSPRKQRTLFEPDVPDEELLRRAYEKQGRQIAYRMSAEGETP